MRCLAATSPKRPPPHARTPRRNNLRTVGTWRWQAILALRQTSNPGERRRLMADFSSTALRQVPRFTSQLLSLHVLRANHCSLRRMPDEIAALRCLVELSLRDNQIRELIGEADLPRLLHLDVSQNELEDLPAWVWASPCLQHLDASCNHIAALSDRIGNCLELRVLMLSTNAVSLLPSELGRCLSLEVPIRPGSPHGAEPAHRTFVQRTPQCRSHRCWSCGTIQPCRGCPTSCST
jgi:Leucine-rich repeat (LRR) protein